MSVVEGGGCAGGGVPLGAVPTLSWCECEEVSLGGIDIIIVHRVRAQLCKTRPRLYSRTAGRPQEGRLALRGRL